MPVPDAKDSNGCNICQCKCPTYSNSACESTCSNLGKVPILDTKDFNGCEVCLCCPVLDCDAPCGGPGRGKKGPVNSEGCATYCDGCVGDSDSGKYVTCFINWLLDVCLSVLGGGGVCEAYIVHHFVGTWLHCAPLTCIVHYQSALCTGGPMSLRSRGHPRHFSRALFPGRLNIHTYTNIHRWCKRAQMYSIVFLWLTMNMQIKVHNVVLE